MAAFSTQLGKTGKYGDLKKRLFFLLGALVVFRIGAHIPVPGIDPNVLADLFRSNQGGILSLFFVASVAALAVCLGAGILIATFARNLQQALLIAFFVLFPTMFLSGTIVPVETMPAALQALSAASPIRDYLEIALGTLLKGVGWSVLWPPLAVLAAMGVGLAGVSLARLRRRLVS